jgi:CubicO group peptidase (beta-lactamase class C family)
VLNGEKPANTPAIRSEAVPGAKWNYSGGGYTIMQQALIDVTKEAFPKLLHDTVLAPIGMTQSTYEQPLPKEFQAYAATPYSGDGKPIKGGAHTYPEMPRPDCGPLQPTWPVTQLRFRGRWKAKRTTSSPSK